ncbi:hypothetical protein [Hyphomonas pacifica]|uniref:hypothetical protein n=1 Tax=Hyphomonas pacifica TaxID=1280941 RepID=UPI000DC01656|nr:hypothetical protein [Hyphomonas pacifica]RAN33790.1 hypothetical protein HY11_03595 [Hyphomonas pacifica]
MRLSGESSTGVPLKATLICLLVMFSLFATSFAQGRFGQIGSDNDDVMRLVQIKDLMAGQGWFDLTQTRLGPDGGTLMHWSRLVDLPIMLLTWFFDLFLASDTALVWAYSVWPPLCVLGVLAGVYFGSVKLAGHQAALFCLALAGILLLGHYRFLPGAIDHHNMQLALMVLAIGLLADPRRGAVQMTWAGLATALSVAIGGEVYVFAGTICAFVALDWALTGQAARNGAIGFGAGLVAGLEACFFATIAPADYTRVACDALSSVSLLAGMVGGLGLAVAALLTSGRSLVLRCVALGLVGCAAGAVLLLTGPQCLSNPLSELSPQVRHLWLDQVNEARPVLAPSPAFLQDVPFRLGVMVVALIICGWRIWRRVNVRAHLLFLALIGAALALTFYQARFYAFGHVFAILPLGLWVADLYRQGKAKGEGSVVYLGALALSLPIVWGMPGLLLTQRNAEISLAARADNAACLGDELYTQLNSLPQGRILASADFGPILLLRTRDSVLYGNYHRNAMGIEQAIQLILSRPGESQALLNDAGIAYVIACPSDPETRFMTQQDSEGLMARLNRGEVPSFLRAVPLPETRSGAATLYIVHPNWTDNSVDDDIS